MDKLACMQAFVAVVDNGGFTRAAHKSGVSKALISKYVGQLEAVLGLRLLHRTTRQVSTTTSGQAYYERCKLLLEELAELDASVQSGHVTPTGELKINAPASFAELHLMPVLLAFSKQYPDVQVKLEMTDRFVDLVEEGVDLAIRIADLTDSSLVARKLGTVSMLVCASPQYIAAHGEPKVPADLLQHQCLIDTNFGYDDRWCIGSKDEGEWVFVSGPIQVNSARAARELLLAGQGIGLMPSFVVAEDIASGRLVRLFCEIEPEQQGIYAMYTHRKHLSAKVRLFIESLQTNLDQGKL